MNAQQETYADKIAKLLRKAEGTTNQAEADLFFAKAQELMTKYAIDEAMIAAASGVASSDLVVTEEFLMVGSSREGIMNVTYQVILNNGCRALVTRDKYRVVNGKEVKCHVLHVTGFKSDVDRSRMLDMSLQIQFIREKSRWWRENQARYVRGGGAARASFAFGYASAVGVKMKTATAMGRKLAEEEEARRRNLDANKAKDSVALVLMSRHDQVLAVFNAQGAGKARSRRSNMDSFAYGSGSVAGAKADVGQPTFRGKRKEIGG